MTSVTWVCGCGAECAAVVVNGDDIMAFYKDKCVEYSPAQPKSFAMIMIYPLVGSWAG